MPTAARLLAAIGFALVGFFASESYKMLLPEGTDVGHFSLINTGIGLISGWLVMGRVAGEGYRAAIAQGIRTSAVLVFYALILHSLMEMLKRSTRLNYDGPMDAVAGMFALAAEYGLLIVYSPTVMIILIVGGILAAWLSEWAAMRWS